MQYFNISLRSRILGQGWFHTQSDRPVRTPGHSHQWKIASSRRGTWCRTEIHYRYLISPHSRGKIYNCLWLKKKIGKDFKTVDPLSFLTSLLKTFCNSLSKDHQIPRIDWRTEPCSSCQSFSQRGLRFGRHLQTSCNRCGDQRRW